MDRLTQGVRVLAAMLDRDELEGGKGKEKGKGKGKGKAQGAWAGSWEEGEKKKKGKDSGGKEKAHSAWTEHWAKKKKKDQGGEEDFVRIQGKLAGEGTPGQTAAAKGSSPGLLYFGEVKTWAALLPTNRFAALVAIAGGRGGAKFPAGGRGIGVGRRVSLARARNFPRGPTRRRISHARVIIGGEQEATCARRNRRGADISPGVVRRKGTQNRAAGGENSPSAARMREAQNARRAAKI